MVSTNVQAISAEGVVAGHEIEFVLLAGSERRGKGCCSKCQGAEDGSLSEQHVVGDSEKEAWGAKPWGKLSQTGERDCLM